MRVDGFVFSEDALMRGITTTACGLTINVD